MGNSPHTEDEEYWKFMDKNLKQFLIICSPGVRQCLRSEGGYFKYLIQINMDSVSGFVGFSLS